MMETPKGTELCFPQLLNDSCKKPMPSQSHTLFVHTVISSISLFTVVLNLLVIISISHFRCRYLLMLIFSNNDIMIQVFSLKLHIYIFELN